MYYSSKTITNTVRLTYQYTVDPSLAPKQVITEDSVSNLIIFPSDLGLLPLFKTWRNDIYFCHGKLCKLHHIKQHIQAHDYKIVSHKSYNVLKISVTICTTTKYKIQQRMRPYYDTFTTPVTLSFIVPKYIQHNILNLAPYILEVCPPKLAAHHISFHTIFNFDIAYREDI